MGPEEIAEACGLDPEQAARLTAALREHDGQLQKERDRLRALFDEAPVYLILFEGPELRLTMVNRRFLAAGGAMLGRCASELLPPPNPALEALQRAYATGVPESLRAQPSYFSHEEFAHRYFTRTFVPVRDADGGVNAVLSVGYDVTEDVRALQQHQESERQSQAELERLGALLEEAPVLISVLEGTELRVVLANRRMREITQDREPIGRSLVDVIPPDNEALAACRRAYETGSVQTVEFVSRNVGGLLGRSFSSTLVPIRDAQGRVTRVMTASLETTEQRRTREALEVQARDLEVARRQAVEASRAKDEFLAMLGHELRNPLAPMLMTLSHLRALGVGAPEVDILERQVRHLTRLVDDLLDIARVTRGVVELKRQDIELLTIVNYALEMTGPIIEERRHRVTSDVVPAVVHGDPDRLAQVVSNLVTNAAKYSPEGSQIRIRSSLTNERVIVSVSDDGVGIAPDLIETVFEPFVQRSQPLARSSGGLGLGLTIVRTLVQSHGGSVSARSDGPGKGSTFVIELPRVERTKPRPRIDPLGVRLRSRTPAKRILVVDDNPDAATALLRSLQALGHTVLVAHDGPSALAESASFKPELGILDIGLPGMDGYELAASLRATHDIRLIAITGYGRESDRLRCRAAGFEIHLVKPVALDQLTDSLDRLSDPGPGA